MPQTALNCDGNGDYVEASGVRDLANDNALTVCAWAKSSQSTWNDAGCILSRRYQFIIHPQSGEETIRFYVNTENGWQDFTAWTPGSGESITDPHHYAITYDGSTATAYVDGESVGSGSPGTSLSSDTGPVYIGADDQADGWTSRHLDGVVDDARIYNRELSSAEMSSLASGENITDGLVSHWPIREGSGSTVEDIVGGNDGTINGDPQRVSGYVSDWVTVQDGGSVTLMAAATTARTTPQFNLISDGETATATNGLTSDTTSDGGRLGTDVLQASDTAIIEDAGQTVDSIATPTTAQVLISADDGGSVVASATTILDQDDFAYTDVPGSLTASTSTTESGSEDGIGEESPAPTASSVTTFQSGTFSLGFESPSPEVAIASPTTTSDTGTAAEAGSTEPATASPTTTSDTGIADDADHRMYFRGVGTSDGVSITHDESISFQSTDFTIALRCSVPHDLDVNSNNNYRGFLGKPGAFSSYDILFEDRGEVAFSTHHTDGNSNRNFAGYFPMDGTPFTVVCTHDHSAGENANWIDGVHQGTSTNAAGVDLSTNTDDLRIGQGGNDTLLSIVDEVRIDARKWSQSEIERYAEGDEPDTVDTRLLLGFDAGEGSTVYDRSAYSNDGTTDGSPEWVPGAERTIAHPTTTSDTGTAAEAGSLTDALSAVLSASTFGTAQDTAEIETALTAALSASESALTIVDGSTTGSFASALSGSDFAYTDVPGSLSSGSFSVFSGDEYGIGDESPAPTQGAVSTFSADEFGLGVENPPVVDALATVLSAAEYGVADESGAVEAAFVTTESGEEYGIGDETPTPTATQATPIEATLFSYADDAPALQNVVGEAPTAETFGFADDTGATQAADGVSVQAETLASADDASAIQDAIASTLEAAETGDTFVRGEIQGAEVTVFSSDTFGFADDQSEETEAVVVTLSGVEYDMTGVIRTTDDGVTQS